MTKTRASKGQRRTINDEWLFGDSLLAAPVLADVPSRDIHVPAGRWYDVLHDCVVDGQTDLHDYPVSLADVPLFLKLGTGSSGLLLNALAHGRQAGSNTAHC